MTRALSFVLLGTVLAIPAHGQAEPRPQEHAHGSAPAVSSSRADASSPAPRPLYQRSTTWYEFMLRELNPRDVDMGAWYEARRKALLNASLRSRYFWHSFWVSLAGILLTTALVKTWYDRRRERRIMGEQTDELRAHDAYSRQMAHEAIRQYNEHIELCNRAIEATDAGLSTALGGNSPLVSLRAERDQAKEKAEGLERDKQRLEAELERKTALITDLSLRIDALTKQVGNGHGSDPANVSTASHPELVRHINSLQQQLYAEREKNKRLKGGA